MSKINKLIIAAAGAGKTTYLINEALRHDKEVLITTYTEVNENEIKKKFIEINGLIPKNVTIQTWFSMLLQHGVKPYQDYLTDKKINGNYYIDEAGLKELEANNQILLKYCTKDGEVTNMNGSVSNIAGICNKERNVFGLMPHPERAIEEILGSTDGVNMLKGLLK
jgi:superfamily I DNA/RNA helicase